MSATGPSQGARPPGGNARSADRDSKRHRAGRGDLRSLASRDLVAHSARDPPPRDDLSPRERRSPSSPGGRARRSHRSSLQRARRVPAGAPRAARAPDPGHRRHRRVRRLEDRGPRHQFPPDREHDPHEVRRTGNARDRRALRRVAAASSPPVIATELASLRPAPATNATPPRPSGFTLRALFGHARRDATVAGRRPRRRERRHRRLGGRRSRGGDALRAAACRALARIASALVVRHGSIWGDRDTIAAMALDLACNALRQRRHRRA